MFKSKFILAGLLMGAMAMGTACKSTSSSERGEPMEPAAAPQPPPPAPPPPPGTGGAGMDNPETGIVNPYTVPQEDRAGTGGTGYDDSVTNPNASDTSNSKINDIRKQDPVTDPGTGGSGYDQDDSLFKQDQSLGGDKFPGDHNVPQ